MRKKTVSSIIVYFVKAHPKRSIVTVGCLLLSGLAEGVGIISILSVFDLVTVGNVTNTSNIGLIVTKILGFFNFSPTIGVLLSLITIGIILKAAFLLLAMKHVGYTVAHIVTHLRLTLIRALLAARWSYFTTKPTGYFSNAVNYETNTASGTYQSVCQLISNIIQMLVYSIIVIAISWKIALFSSVAVSLVILTLKGLIEVSRRAGERQTELMKSLNARLIDGLQGIKLIKSMGQEIHLQPLLESETHSLNETYRRQVAASETLRILHEPMVASLIAIGLYSAMTFGSQPFSALLMTVFIFQRLSFKVHSTQQFYQSISIGESAFWSLQENIENAQREKELPESTDQKIKPSLEKTIVFSKIGFSYNDKTVLKDVSLTIPAGQLVSIVGPSGEGKTTIADLIIGLFQPQLGSIFIDNVPLQNLDLAAWRHIIGYVPQEMFLFHDTIYNNVNLGNHSISYTNVKDALHAADAWSFVSELDQGMDSIVGERGTKLSGGQRQRIAIARALVRKPKLLILDEVTTALDPKTEQEICETLKQLRKKMTILSISHQPAINNIADKIYKLNQGCIEELPPPLRTTEVKLKISTA